MLTVVVFIAATIQTWRLFEVWHLNKLIFIQSINLSVTAMDMDLIDSFTVKLYKKRCGPLQNGQYEKSCEIKRGSQENGIGLVNLLCVPLLVLKSASC